jgi:hypothetical protein
VDLSQSGRTGNVGTSLETEMHLPIVRNERRRRNGSVKLEWAPIVGLNSKRYDRDHERVRECQKSE